MVHQQELAAQVLNVLQANIEPSPIEVGIYNFLMVVEARQPELFLQPHNFSVLFFLSLILFFYQYSYCGYRDHFTQLGN